MKLRRHTTLEDRKPMTDAQRDLAAKYAHLAASIGRSYADRYPEIRDEIMSAATYGLFSAAQDHDPSKAKFGYYAKMRIIGAITGEQQKRWAKKRDRTREAFSIDATDRGLWSPSRKYRRASLRFRDVLSDKSPAGDHEARVDDAEEVEYLLSLLTERQASAYRECYLEGHTQRQAGEVLGCTFVTVYRDLRDGRDLVRRLYSEATS